MRLFEDDELIHDARVIVGKAKHQTPTFSDEMETVVLKPVLERTQFDRHQGNAAASHVQSLLP